MEPFTIVSLVLVVLLITSTTTLSVLFVNKNTSSKTNSDIPKCDAKPCYTAANDTNCNNSCQYTLSKNLTYKTACDILKDNLSGQYEDAKQNFSEFVSGNQPQKYSMCNLNWRSDFTASDSLALCENNGGRMYYSSVDPSNTGYYCAVKPQATCTANATIEPKSS